MKPSTGFLAFAVAVSACASYPARPPAPADVHSAVLQYQIDHQGPSRNSAVFVAIRETPDAYAPRPSVLRALDTHGAPLFVSPTLKVIPPIPQEQWLSISVFARPERSYANRIVILGSVTYGPIEHLQGGDFRYILEPQGRFWHVVHTESVLLDTDCYGNLWFKCSSHYPE